MKLMEIVEYKKEEVKNLTQWSQTDVNQVIGTVTEIIENIKENKDLAVKNYTEKFDKAKIENLQVTKDEINEAYNTLDDEIIESLKAAAKNIEKFHKEEIPEEWSITVQDGINAGQIIRPLNSVGCYIPGGRAVYPSSILMTVIPAKIAGVKRIICCTPPNPEGKIQEAILVAADIAGADEIYKVGGAQAIAAMAYGTETIKPIEKIVGPGNIFVTAAKKLVYGDVDIEFPAGPSELLIIAEENAKPEYLAYDILSQAEHDPNASCFLVTNNKNLAEETDKLIVEYTNKAKRQEIIEESLNKYGKIVITKTLKEAIDFSNEYAPEHLIINIKNNTKTLEQIKNAGSIFIGQYSPVAAGDYGSGTNHVLPTGRGARMYSGLSTEDFLKKPTVQELSQEGLEKLSKTIIPIAEYEGFEAHANSVKIRIKK